jgi:hypothetical protein
MDCLAGPSCAAEFLDEDSFNLRSMQTLFGDASLLAPYVKVKVSGTAGTITVGNNSSPDVSNHACIKSFQYGKSDGLGMTCEIIDEEGGVFHNFFQKIVNKFDTADQKYELDAEWGWIRRGCDNNEQPVFKTLNLHRCVLLTVDIEMGSVIKFTLEGRDLLQVTYEGRAEKAFGTDDNPMRLKDAIIRIFKENKPPISNIHFLRKLCGGGTETWEFDNDPKGVWRADQQHALASVNKWIRPFTTNKQKGIITTWDDSQETPSVILWEDGGPPCNTIDECDRKIGSYIINGGNCSNVISFKTNIHWNFAAAANTGGAVSTNSAGNVKQQDEVDCNIPDEGAGTSTGNIDSDNSQRNHGRSSLDQTTKNDKKHDRATRNLGQYEPIQGELTLIGDPSLDSWIDLQWSTVGILYINPIHLEANVSGCANWIVSSNCNPVLSNKEWRINGVSHEISEGKYTTTLRLFLASPGVTIGENQPIGDNLSGEQVSATT